jgi:hypothetical protein
MFTACACASHNGQPNFFMSLKATMRPVSPDLEDQCTNPSLQPSLVSQLNPDSSLAGDLNAGSEPNQEAIVCVEPNWLHVLQFGVPLFHLKSIESGTNTNA